MFKLQHIFFIVVYFSKISPLSQPFERMLNVAKGKNCRHHVLSSISAEQFMNTNFGQDPQLCN